MMLQCDWVESGGQPIVWLLSHMFSAVRPLQPCTLLLVEPWKLVLLLVSGTWT